MTIPTLSWQSYKIGLSNNQGNSAQHTFVFDGPIKTYAIGLSAFAFEFEENKGIYLQDFDVSATVLALHGTSITVNASASFLDHENFNYGGWVRVTVLAWLDEGDGNPPVLLANRKGLASDQSAVSAVAIPTQGTTPDFVLGQDFFAPFISGFRLGLGPTDLQNNPQTATYLSAGTGIDVKRREINLNGQAEMRGVGQTIVYQTNVKNNKTTQDNKNYTISTVKSGTVDVGCLALSKNLKGYEIKPLSLTQSNDTNYHGTQYSPSVQGKLPFSEVPRDFAFLIQRFTLGKVREEKQKPLKIAVLNIDFWANPKNAKEYTAVLMATYYDSNEKTNPYLWGFGNVDGLLIGKL